MKPFLTFFSLLVLAALVGVSVWATSHVSIVPALADIFGNPAERFNPWFWATLFDAYFGFLWFYLWVAYKETGLGARIGWLMGILLAGNMAMAVYMLVQLRKLPPNPRVEDLLLRHAQ